MGGSAVFADNVPDFDATVVTRLNDAGAVILGKLNLTEGAMGGYNPKLDIPENPWADGHWAGQSSSGSGVATAAGMAFGTLGSDTGGSIRYPAAACGTVRAGLAYFDTDCIWAMTDSNRRLLPGKGSALAN